MKRQRSCLVEGCGNEVHAKGYCRKHYGQIWRKGKIYDDPDEIPSRSTSTDDRLRSLQAELRRAEVMYENVYGLESRIKWRREVDQIKRELRVLEQEAVASV